MKDLSRGGVVLSCDLTPVLGTEVHIDLPGTTRSVSGRVVRSGAGVLAISFHQDPAALAQIDAVLDAVGSARKAA